MGMYDLKAECLTPLRNVCNHEYEGELAAQFKTLQAACESRRWNLESSMETEAGMVLWISALDAALAAFQRATRPEDTLRIYVDKQIAASKAKADEMRWYLHRKELRAAQTPTSLPPHAHIETLLGQMKALA